MKVKISIEEIRRYLDIETPEFPKYAAPLINLANRFSQGTRPRVVGQMTELINDFSGKTLAEWEQWCLEQKREEITTATEKILKMLNNFKKAIDKIDQTMIGKWVRDLIIVKTFLGLRFQEAILKRGAEIKGTGYRLSNPDEESKGIDGFIGDIPVSIKPRTYETKAELLEHIEGKVIYKNPC